MSQARLQGGAEQEELVLPAKGKGGKGGDQAGNCLGPGASVGLDKHVQAMGCASSHKPLQVMGDTRGGSEILIGDMIGVDLDGECCTLKFVAPSAKSFDGGEELFLVHWVFHLMGGEFVEKESDGLQAFAMVLLEDRSDGKVGGVGTDDERLGGIREGKNRCVGEGCFQTLESLVLAIGLLPWLGTEKLSQRGGNRGVVSDEMLVETCQTEELTQVFNLARRWPRGNGLNLGWQGREAGVIDKMACILGGGALELALAWGCITFSVVKVLQDFM
jgi:hypothetical protein